MEAAHPWVIGVDGGGTKTAAVLADFSGRVWAWAEGPGTNPNFVGRAAALAVLRRVIGEVLERAGLPAEPDAEARERVACAALCVPGLRTLEREAAEAASLPPGRVLLSSDVHSTFYGALGREAGIVALAGTGSFVLGTNEAGETARAGGWGPVVGDEGSGHMIAVRALQAVGREHDGRGPATRLTAGVLRHFGVPDAHALKSAVKLDNVSKLTVVVREAADAGDALAQAILAEAGRALADMAADVAARLGMAAGACEVALTGGLPRIGAGYTAPFAERLAERCPGARVAEPLLPPAGGAVLLALRECGVPWTAEVTGRLREAFGKRQGPAHDSTTTTSSTT